MTEEIGVVKSVEGVSAKVIIERHSACNSCCSGCESQDDSSLMVMDALNAVEAQVGQRVKISFKPIPYLKGVLFVYALPMIVFFAAALIGKKIGELYFPAVNSDLVAAAFSFTMLILSYVLLKVWSTKTQAGQGHHPVIEEIIEGQG